MRFTSVMRVAKRRMTPILTAQRPIKSLALSVYFKQPDFGMKDYEILSRASCFLLGIDPPEENQKDGPYAHLEASQRQRELKQYKSQHKYSPAGGAGRNIMELGWLEFVPRELRPQVHVVCSSHVLSPFLWNDYYPQNWLKQVRQEHVAYSLEVYDSTKPQESLAKLALNAQPFHHPEGRDIALVHFKEEQASLKILTGLGVEILHLRHADKLYEKGEQMIFDGYVVSEPNATDSSTFDKKQSSSAAVDNDVRIFYPYTETGTLSMHTQDRFFASTPEPLPEGLCGAPVLDVDHDLCGTVEGIVPVTHKNERLAGSAAFLPSYVMKHFVDYVERGLLEQMMPRELFEMVVTAKKTNSIGGGVFKADDKGTFTGESSWEEAYDIALKFLKSKYSSEEVDSILTAVNREREEVLNIMDKEGGDIDDVVKRVRLKTMEMRELVRDQYRQEKSKEEVMDQQQQS
ncbi:hypothetical protein MPSEU_000969400 [Mayamaea pseudoterrestris]|nr:hypothetical protein MPSEU_000969400 [Mayamaea pseudoterrestris]